MVGRNRRLLAKNMDEVWQADRRAPRIFWGKGSFGVLADVQEVFGKRLAILKLLVIVVFLGLFSQLFNLTIISGKKNRELAEGNRIRLVTVEAKRGKIFDRNGQLLSDSQEIFVLENNQDQKEISEKSALELEREGLAGREFIGEFGRIIRQIRRDYKLGEAASHILGYISPVNNKDLEERENLESSDLVGRLGVEVVYDDFLRGKNGQKLVEVDALGKKVSILDEQSPISGRNLHLTIESDLQKFTFEALKRQAEKIGTKRGAVIIQDVKTGEILALASYPSFDSGSVAQVINDQNKPLFNRAVQGVYPPGSIFKIVSSLAGLENGQVDKNTEIEDVGEFYIGDVRFANWYFLNYGGRDGILKIDRAIARSNDIFFYRLAEKIGLLPLRQMAIKLGFGQKTGIDLSDESLGLVPDEVWKKSAKNEPWFMGDTLHLAIGQGFVLATPVQVNSLISYMVSGRLMQPSLVSRIEGQDSQDLLISPKIIGENLVSAGNLEIVREGMKKACETGGTGWPFFNAGYLVGCKTGTAERAFGNPHAWFGAFAPFDNPQVSITVIIEEGGEGSSVAAPVAREILDWYFQNKK